MKTPSPRNPLIAVVSAVLILIFLSLMPWGKLSGNFFKDFNILEDICTVKTDIQADGEIVDPELVALLNGPEDDANSSVAETQTHAGEFAENDSCGYESVDEISVVEDIPEEISPRIGDLVVIEDYSTGRPALSRFSNAIRESSSRPVRIAMIGDSYIEGDVFSQNIRENLQSIYGGRGAGYQMMHTDIPGFRQSVSQTDKGWTAHDIRNSSRESCKWLAGEYYSGGSGATSTYKGVKRLQHADARNRNMFLFIAPKGGTVSITTDSGTQDFAVAASDSVQCIDFVEETTKFSIKNNTGEMTALGVWLSDNTGIVFDCMSLRGNSGITHRKLDEDLARQMSEFVPYDLIIVEYGINALSSSQKDYSKYGKYMEEVVNTLKACYPEADILLMGIGDRGQKSGSEVHSLSTASNMVSTQRAVARRCGIAFWDTREAMGGDDAIVNWRERKLVNADYIHLNHKGGEELARLFVDALKNYLSQ